MTEWDWWENDPAWLDEPEDKPRCELDHRDGGVCLRTLRKDGTCSGEAEHT